MRIDQKIVQGKKAGFQQIVTWWCMEWGTHLGDGVKIAKKYFFWSDLWFKFWRQNDEKELKIFLERVRGDKVRKKEKKKEDRKIGSISSAKITLASPRFRQVIRELDDTN